MSDRYTFDTAYLQLPLLVCCIYPTRHVRLFIEAGPVIPHTLQLDNALVKTDNQGRTSVSTCFF